MPTSLDEALAAADAALRAQDPMAAWRALQPVLSFPSQAVDQDPSLQRALAGFGKVAAALGSADLAAKVRALVGQVNQPQPLYDTAFALYEAGLFGMAATLLVRANRIAPGVPAIVSELSSALEAMGLYGHAALYLDASGLPSTDPVCAYLSGYNWLMSGDLEHPRERLSQIAQANEGPLPEMRAGLAGMIARADALTAAGIALDELALTAWHAVIHGTALLHESPHGHPDPMSGRYAYVADSPGLMREGIERLAQVLASRDEVDRVLAAPDRASRILALATAERLGLPLQPWTASEPASGLVVAWTLDAVQDEAFYRAFAEHAPKQLLFAHGSCWTQPFPYAPDVTTLLYQTLTHPFTGGALRIDQASGQAEPMAADARSDEACARDILEAEPSDPSVSSMALVAAVVGALARLPEEQRGSVHRTSGRRRHQRSGGPVPSARFH